MVCVWGCVVVGVAAGCARSCCILDIPSSGRTYPYWDCDRFWRWSDPRYPCGEATIHTPHTHTHAPHTHSHIPTCVFCPLHSVQEMSVILLGFVSWSRCVLFGGHGVCWCVWVGGGGGYLHSPDTNSFINRIVI